VTIVFSVTDLWPLLYIGNVQDNYKFTEQLHKILLKLHAKVKPALTRAVFSAWRRVSLVIKILDERYRDKWTTVPSDGRQGHLT
jgi:hypothetical protein